MEDWRAQPLPPNREHWRIAVLVSARTHLPEIIKAFNDDRTSPPIPYRANEIEQLRERQEILDLLALTRALLNPADRTAWLALLRTPWCGLTLVDLHLLAGKDDRTLRLLTLLELIATPRTLLSADAQARLLPCTASSPTPSPGAASSPHRSSSPKPGTPSALPPFSPPPPSPTASASSPSSTSSPPPAPSRFPSSPSASKSSTPPPPLSLTP